MLLTAPVCFLFYEFLHLNGFTLRKEHTLPVLRLHGRGGGKPEYVPNFLAPPPGTPHLPNIYKNGILLSILPPPPPESHAFLRRVPS